MQDRCVACEAQNVIFYWKVFLTTTPDHVSLERGSWSTCPAPHLVPATFCLSANTCVGIAEMGLTPSPEDKDNTSHSEGITPQTFKIRWLTSWLSSTSRTSKDGVEVERVQGSNKINNDGYGLNHKNKINSSELIQTEMSKWMNG